MKKLICNLLAIIMISASLPFAYAEQPSDLKDVNVSESVNPSAEINVKAKMGTSNKNLVKDNNIEYYIKLKAGTEKTSVFTITASCGNVCP